MERRRVVIVTLLIVVFINGISVAYDSSIDYYKQGLLSFKNQDWEEALGYFDEVIMNDLFFSEYRSKSIYLKTIILLAEIEKNLEMYDSFLLGLDEIPFSQNKRKEDFKIKADNYRLNCKRRVDTLLGLSNYLLVNLPPLDMKVNLAINKVENQEGLLMIKEGKVIEEKELEILEEEIFKGKIEKYLKLTLSGKSFNNLFLTRAEEGDSLYYLSHKYQVPFDLLIDVNAHITNPDRIYPNQKVYIPKIKSYALNYPAYFYYVAKVGYSANQERNNEVSKLVLRAYQLTSKGDANTSKSSDSLDKELKSYQEKIRLQAEEIKIKEDELEKIKNDYQVLIKEINGIKNIVNEESSKANKKMTDDYEIYDMDEESYEEYNPKEDLLDY